MNMRIFRPEVVALIAPLAKLSSEEVDDLLEIPPDTALGHYAFPCFKLAKSWKKAPQAISKELASQLNKDLPSFIASFKDVGPYLNVTLSTTSFSYAVLKDVILGGSRYGRSMAEKPKKILVEHMNANPNKPLHLGQARNMCLGDSLIRTHRFLGHIVHSVNYGDDSGVNVAFNITAHLHFDVPVDPPSGEKFDHYSGKVYTEMRKRDSDDPAFKKIRTKISLQIEEGGNDVARFQREVTERCAVAQFESCWRMDTFFDLVNWETDILHLGFFDEAMERLKKTEFIHLEKDGDHKGCWVIDLGKLEGFEGLRTPLAVLLKSDGTATYAAKDIVYAMWKLGYLGKDFFYFPFVEQPNSKWIWSTVSSSEGLDALPKSPQFGGYDLAIAVIDKRQSHEQNVVKGALRVLGFTGEEKEYIHLPYGVVYLTPRTLEHFGFTLTPEESKEKRLPFASRKGWFITIDETLDKLRDKAYKESKSRNENESEEWLQDISENIAVGALRFFLTRLDRNKDLTFDIDDALDLEGETGPYLQYAHTRASAILRKANKSNVDVQQLKIGEDNVALLEDDKERALLMQIAEFGQTIERVSSSLSPDVLCSYLLLLAQQFNSFYNAVPVLRTQGKLLEARLLLVRAVRQVLANGMGLLGIHPPERM